MRQLQVLVVDDSAVVRQVLSAVLGTEMLVTTASDPIIAMMKMETMVPDVVVLDLEMPRMDGLTFLRKLMNERPLPVVICSSLTDASSEMTMRALQLGAVDVVLKPRVGVGETLSNSAAALLETVRGAASAKVGRVSQRESRTADTFDKPTRATARNHITDDNARSVTNVVVAGASTGGTEVIQMLLDSMPAGSPPIVIVQHMPARFTAAFARRLNETSEMQVREATAGEVLTPGVALIAPGDRHIALVRQSYGALSVAIRDTELVNRHRPSVDVLFSSAARALGPLGVGILMTGMGKDGAKGLQEMRNAGAQTIAQDEATSVVFGMPGAAIALGAAASVVPAPQIARFVLEACGMG